MVLGNDQVQDSHVRGRLLGYTYEWNPTLNNDEINKWLI